MAETDETTFMPPRRLRVLAFDPGTGNKFLNRGIREVTITLPWEFDPSNPSASFWGPRGEYIEVVDYDPATGVFYEPIDLNEHSVLLNDGVAASEDDPKFHQQMVYAVSMETIAIFEQALGRRVQWAPRLQTPSEAGEWRESYVQRLRIYPHALREANAYYDPRKKALLFGYFTAGRESRAAPPGTTVFTCLSHDIVVHETVHAILDGMHPRFAEATTPDMLALHEGFADTVAIFQQFTHAAVLEDQIARTRGDLDDRHSLLGELAQEFGEAIGRGGALRSALGREINGKWVPKTPDVRALDKARGPHARGAVLVAAVFRAFLTIYDSRTSDLFRIASGGSGILRNGAIDPDLVKRLSKEAAQAANHVLQICIRAMDYVPPVSVSFGDYLRAIVTADHDLFPEDDNGYRRAFIEAFTAWGIRPEGMPVVSEQALLWPSLADAASDSDYEDADAIPFQAKLNDMVYWAARPSQAIDSLARNKLIPETSVDGLKEDMERVRQAFLDTMKERTDRDANGDTDAGFNINLLEMDLNVDRRFVFEVRRLYAHLFWAILSRWPDHMLELLGMAVGSYDQKTFKTSRITGKPTIDVYSVRIARRAGKRGQQEDEYVVELIQSRDGYRDPDLQDQIDRDGKPQLTFDAKQNGYVDGDGNMVVAFDADQHMRRRGKGPRTSIDDPAYKADFRYRAGCTLLIDARTFRIRRLIRTPFRADSNRGLDRMRQHLSASAKSAMNAFDGPDGVGDPSTAFAVMHRNVGEP